MTAAKRLGIEIDIKVGVGAGGGLTTTEVHAAAEAALRGAGIADGHLAVALVDTDEIKALNRDHRGRDAPTDVLSFPIDAELPVGPRELGDVFVCPQHSSDVREAVVHGVLHLCGYDHERDRGEMLELQARVMAELRGTASDEAGPDVAPR